MIQLLRGFRAKINESGTHIHKGFLKVRVDIYSPIGSKTYSLHWVDHYNREPTDEELLDEALLALIPTHKELNPCLCHFITISPEITKKELRDKVKELFDASTLIQLDDSLPKPNSLQDVHRIMLSKFGDGRKLKDEEVNPALIEQINNRFKEV